MKLSLKTLLEKWMDTDDDFDRSRVRSAMKKPVSIPSDPQPPITAQTLQKKVPPPVSSPQTPEQELQSRFDELVREKAQLLATNRGHLTPQGYDRYSDIAKELQTLYNQMFKNQLGQTDISYDKTVASGPDSQADIKTKVGGRAGASAERMTKPHQPFPDQEKTKVGKRF